MLFLNALFDFLEALDAPTWATAGAALTSTGLGGFLLRWAQKRREHKAIKEVSTATSFPDHVIADHAKLHVPTRFLEKAADGGTAPFKIEGMPLLPWIWQSIIAPGREKFLLVLAPSGMGKTAALIDIYFRYARKFRLRKRKYRMLLLDLVNYDVAKKRISEWPHPEDTILLLDGLDEMPGFRNTKALNRLDELLDGCKAFRTVVVSSRVQLFQGEPIPQSSKVRKPGEGFYAICQAHVLPFNESDTRTLLRRKFNGKQKEKRLVALSMLEGNEDLFSRPLLLQHIEALVEIKAGKPELKFRHVHDVMGELLKWWRDKDLEKAGLIKDREGFDEKADAWDEFHRKVFRALYFKLEKDAEAALTKEELVDLWRAAGNSGFNKEEAFSRSLLQDQKYSADKKAHFVLGHRVILSHGIALEAIENTDFHPDLSLDADAEQFFAEMLLEEWEAKLPKGDLIERDWLKLLGLLSVQDWNDLCMLSLEDAEKYKRVMGWKKNPLEPLRALFWKWLVKANAPGTVEWSELNLAVLRDYRALFRLGYLNGQWELGMRVAGFEGVFLEWIRRDYSGIWDARGLTQLKLDARQLEDISPLKRMVHLQELVLESNQIAELGPLKGLTALTKLFLTSNQIDDFGPLEGLTALTTLGLENNRIANIGPLGGLTTLTELGLGNNQIADIGPLGGLTALTELGLHNNQIAELGPLGGLTALTKLGLQSNQIADTGPLAGLTALTNLQLGSNQIADIGPLGGLKSLAYLMLTGNPVITQRTLFSGFIPPSLVLDRDYPDDTAFAVLLAEQCPECRIVWGRWNEDGGFHVE